VEASKSVNGVAGFSWDWHRVIDTKGAEMGWRLGHGFDNFRTGEMNVSERELGQVKRGSYTVVRP
jgi:hypothetical protein